MQDILLYVCHAFVPLNCHYAPTTQPSTLAPLSALHVCILGLQTGAGTASGLSTIWDQQQHSNKQGQDGTQTQTKAGLSSTSSSSSSAAAAAAAAGGLWAGPASLLAPTTIAL